MNKPDRKKQTRSWPLRRHERQRPQDAARLGVQRVRAVGVRAADEGTGHRLGQVAVRRGGGGRFGQHLGESPVHDLDLAEAADHDVARLEVAVEDPVGVRVGHRLADLLEHRQEAAAVGGRIAVPL